MLRSLLSPRPLDTDLTLLLLRLIFGGLFVYFGWVKIEGYHDILPVFEDYIGIGPKLSFHLLIFAEFFCGILVAIGLLTRVAVIPIFIAMIVAYFIAHGADPFQMKVSAFVFLLLCAVVFVGGSGKYSVDALLFKNK